MKVEKTTAALGYLMTKRNLPAVREAENLGDNRVNEIMSKVSSTNYPNQRSIAVGADYFAMYNNLNFRGKRTGSFIIKGDDIKEGATNPLISDRKSDLIRAYGWDIETYNKDQAQRNKERVKELYMQLSTCLGQRVKLSSMPKERRLQYLNILLTYGPLFFTPEFQEISQKSPIIPTNPAEYSLLIKRLTGKADSRTTSADIRTDFLQYDKNCSVKLLYDKKEFIKDISRILDTLPRIERQKAMECLGIEFKIGADGEMQLIGSPSLFGLKQRIKELKSPATREALTKTIPYINYLNMLEPPSVSNRVIKQQSNKELELITSILKELKAATNSYDIQIDSETFRILKEEASSPEFITKNKTEQKNIILQILLERTKK